MRRRRELQVWRDSDGLADHCRSAGTGNGRPPRRIEAGRSAQRRAGAGASRHRDGPARRSRSGEGSAAKGGARLWPERGGGPREVHRCRGRDCTRLARLELARQGARYGAGGARAARRPDERRARAASRGSASSADRAPRRGRARAGEVRCRALAAGFAGRPRARGRGDRDAAPADRRRRALRLSRPSAPRVMRASRR